MTKKTAIKKDTNQIKRTKQVKKTIKTSVKAYYDYKTVYIRDSIRWKHNKRRVKQLRV